MADEAAVLSRPALRFESLPDLPDKLGVAGAYVGVHDDVLIVAGGANFAPPVWQATKQWHDAIYALRRKGDRYEWTTAGRLPRGLGYGACVNTSAGVLCMGGNDPQVSTDEVFLLSWNTVTNRVTHTPLAPLPCPCAYGQAVVIGDSVYLAGGQSGADLTSAMSNFWVLDMSPDAAPQAWQWREFEAWPAPPRAFNITVAQFDGRDECVYVIGGRYQQGAETHFLTDVWQYSSRTKQWRQRADVPRCVMAGAAAPWGERHVVVVSGADGELFHRTDELKDRHPGFAREAWQYDTFVDEWTSAGAIPQNQVTTPITVWGDRIILSSGEVRPRVRTPRVWAIEFAP